MSPQIPSKIETRHYINGEFSASSDGGTFALASPYSHEKVADVCEATEDDVNRAVASAKAAFPSWSNLDPLTRGTYLSKLSKLMEEAIPELAQLEALSMGRPVSAYFDPSYAKLILEHFAHAGFDAKGETSLNMPGYVNMSFRQPIGPVAAIIPWNVPVVMFVMKMAPALAAGCTVVVKTSEKAPLTSLKLASLVHQIGLPSGVLNVINGHGTPAGSALSAHMDIRLVHFTGSTATGRRISAAAANSNLKKVVLELGGKSPCVVFEDADVAKAAKEAAGSISLNSGQVCFASSRVYVHEKIADEFKKAYVANLGSISRGDPLLAETQQGPQADEAQHKRIQEFLTSASEGQGELELGGKVTQADGKGWFVEPTVYSNIGEHERAQREEVFGPFSTVNTFITEAEVLAKANDTEYGLYASVYTKDLSRALRVAKAFEAGVVAVNATSPTATLDLPFGGYKSSGNGREGLTCGLDEFLEHKQVVIKVDDA